MGLDPFAHSLSSKEMRNKYYLARNGKDKKVKLRKVEIVFYLVISIPPCCSKRR